MNRIIARLRAAWNSLPSGVQATLMMAAAAAGTSLGKALFDSDAACWQWHCLRHDLGAAIVAGFMAGRAFYMLPNRPAKPPEPEPDPVVVVNTDPVKK